MKLKLMTLRTNHLQELSQLLSLIFEAEIEPHENGAILKGEQDFLLLPSGKSRFKESTSFQYSFDQKEEFDFFFNKINFWLYRQGKKALTLTENEQGIFFSIEDPDGREWSFLFS